MSLNTWRTIYRLTLKYSAKLAQLWPASVSPIWLEYSLQYPSMVDSNCISKLIRSRHTCSDDHGPEVHLPTGSITASNCMSKRARSQPPCTSAHLLHSSLQVHPHDSSTMASKCITKLGRSQASCISLNSPQYGL
jgi:hypothetical protein